MSKSGRFPLRLVFFTAFKTEICETLYSNNFCNPKETCFMLSQLYIKQNQALTGFGNVHEFYQYLNPYELMIFSYIVTKQMQLFVL